jgi:DNA-binding FadR family transcriptional regulator
MRHNFSPGKISDAARRLTLCIIGGDDPMGTLAHEAVSAVEMHFMQRGWPVGEALGALPEVQQGLGLGRPACREAIIILEARGLLDVRRGPGGGLFVAAPTAQDVVGAMLMYLSISGASGNCIQEFRLLVWRMVVEAAIDCTLCAPATPAIGGEWGFAVDLAQRIGNPAMALVAQIAEMLARTCDGSPAPGYDVLLERALRIRDTRQAISRLEVLAAPPGIAAPCLTLDAVERGFARTGCKLAMVLAARMAREMIHRPDKVEAEWETADRLGYSDSVVRQARRILQDFGAVRCQRGRKGAFWGAPVGPSGVIRLLAPCLLATGMTKRDNTEVANFLACSAPRLAAVRAAEYGRAQIEVLGPFASSLEFIDLIRIENLLLDMAGNPLLSIMTRSLGLANLLSLDAKISPQRRVDIVAFNVRLLHAVQVGDAATASLLARAKGEVIRESGAAFRKRA